MTKDIALREQYPVLAAGSSAAAVLTENLDGETISPTDLVQIRMPAAGGTAWAIPQIDGTEKHEPAIEGIIVASVRRRAYWAKADASGDPPDCSSLDCVTGRGTPGGLCEKCPLNQFGSGQKQDGSAGRGKACKEAAMLFVLRKGDTLPVVVKVSPASLKPLRQYKLKLPVPFYSCITKLGLVREKSRDGIAYAKLVPSFVAALSNEDAAAVRDYATSLQTAFNRTADAEMERGEE